MSDVAEVIFAVAALVAAVSLGIYLWRRPDASVRFRHKESEIEVGPSAPPTTLADRKQLPAATAEREGPSEEPVAPPAAKEGDDETRFRRAVRLLTSGQYDEGMALIQQEAQEDQDPTNATSTIALGQYLAATRGSEKALSDLRRTANAHQQNSKVQVWLGMALLRSGSPSEADEVFLRAHSMAESDEDRATALVWRAHDAADPARNPEVAHDLLTRSRTLESARARSQVYARAARLYLDARPPDATSALALFELAIDLTPADTSLRFDVAHALGEADADAGALLHYTELITRDETHDGALNNRGVAAASLGLESIAVDSYRSAEALGHTLATANLGWKLINAGFLIEARKSLEAVVTKPDVHQNVLEALGGAAKQRNSDERRRDEILERARRVSFVRQHIGTSIAAGASLGPDAVGVYKDGTATLQIDVKPNGGVIGELRQPFSGVWDVTGKVLGAAFTFVWETRKDENRLLSSLLIAKKGHGVMVRVGDELHGFTYEGDHQEDPSPSSSFKDWRFVPTPEQPTA